MSGWQPIDTVPLDGTWVLLTGGNSSRHQYGDQPNNPGMAICRWPIWEAGGWRDQWDDYYGPENPTHWMPLPDPPSA